MGGLDTVTYPHSTQRHRWRQSRYPCKYQTCVIQPHDFQPDFIVQDTQSGVPTSALNVPGPGLSSAVNDAAAEGQWISVYFVHLQPLLTIITLFPQSNMLVTFQCSHSYLPVASSNTSITPSDAATILLHMSQQGPTSHTSAMEQAPTSLPSNKATLPPNSTTAAKPRARNPTNKSGTKSAPVPAAKATLDTKARRSQRNKK
jgi:hypothetical protein